MRFRLYFHQLGSSSETLFYDSSSTDENTAIVDPKLKLELGKAGTLEFKMMPTHTNFDDFHFLSTYVRVLMDAFSALKTRFILNEL